MFGERLRGTVKVNATLKSPGKKDILVHEETKELVSAATPFSNRMIMNVHGVDVLLSTVEVRITVIE